MTLYLFLGYTAAWTALFVYFLYLAGRESALERDVQWLQERMNTGRSE